MDCQHYFVQKDQYWYCCSFCGMLSPNGNRGINPNLQTSTDAIMTQENQPKDMTAEEIFFNIIKNKGDVDFRSSITGQINQEDFVKAMETYADQQTKHLQDQIDELEQWKKEQINTFLPLMEFMHSNTELNAGESISKKAIEFIKERNLLRQSADELACNLQLFIDSWKSMKEVDVDDVADKSHLSLLNYIKLINKT